MTTTDTPDTGIVGNLASPPEVRRSASGVSYLRCRLSVHRYVPKGAPKPEPEYIDLTCFGGLAENVAANLHQGDRVVVSGRLEHGTWTGRDGIERSTSGIVAQGVGLDLRFSADTTGIEPRPKATPVMDELVGAKRGRNYSEEPF